MTCLLMINKYFEICQDSLNFAMIKGYMFFCLTLNLLLWKLIM